MCNLKDRIITDDEIKEISESLRLRAQQLSHTADILRDTGASQIKIDNLEDRANKLRYLAIEFDHEVSH